MLLWAFVYVLLHRCVFSSLDYIPGMELLGHMLILFLTFEELPSCFPELLQHLTFSLAMSEEFSSVQFISVAQSCLTLCNLMNHGTPGLPVHYQLLESTQTHVHRVNDAIQPSHPLSSPSAAALNLYQHQGLFQWASSSHQVAKVLEFQLQHKSFQWMLRTDLL